LYIGLILFKLDGWYKISRQDLQKRGGQSLLLRSTLPELLREAYPFHPWDLTRFRGAQKAPQGHWKKKENILKAIKAAEIKIGLEKVAFTSVMH